MKYSLYISVRQSSCLWKWLIYSTYKMHATKPLIFHAQKYTRKMRRIKSESESREDQFC